MALDPLASIASSRQMAQAAEKIAAAQFARCGFDVSAQDASDRPMYNLVVAKAGVLLKVSVLCSQNGAWSLTQPYLKRASELRGGKTDHQGAIDLWLDHQSSRTVCCLIQFQGVANATSRPRLSGFSQRTRQEIARGGHWPGRFHSV